MLRTLRQFLDRPLMQIEVGEQRKPCTHALLNGHGIHSLDGLLLADQPQFILEPGGGHAAPCDGTRHGPGCGDARQAEHAHGVTIQEDAFGIDVRQAAQMGQCCAVGGHFMIEVHVEAGGTVPAVAHTRFLHTEHGNATFHQALHPLLVGGAWVRGVVL